MKLYFFIGTTLQLAGTHVVLAQMSDVDRSIGHNNIRGSFTSSSVIQVGNIDNIGGVMRIGDVRLESSWAGNARLDSNLLIGSIGNSAGVLSVGNAVLRGTYGPSMLSAQANVRAGYIANAVGVLRVGDVEINGPSWGRSNWRTEVNTPGIYNSYWVTSVGCQFY